MKSRIPGYLGVTICLVGVLVAAGCALESNASQVGDDAGIDGSNTGDRSRDGDAGPDTGADERQPVDEGGCRDECASDERECRPGGYRFCGNFNLDDCLEWSDVFPCPENEVCQDGLCVLGCSDACQPGERRCQGAVVEGCADSDGDGCLDWVAETQCAADEVCDPASLGCRRTYPAGPYGTRYGDTMENHCFETCRCQGAQPQAETVCMEDFLGAKAILFSVHTGWCSSCAEQAAGLENDLYRPYHQDGLEIILMFFEDEYRSSERGDLLRLCCAERQGYGMTFTVAIDPGAQIVDRYFSGWSAEIPLNMVLDEDMVIRYQNEGYTWGLEETIRQLLGL